MQAGSVRPEEIARFEALAARWWEPDGPMRPLHMMNPLRAGWILERIERRFGTKNLAVLDVGCGAGLLAEALAKGGCAVTALDAGPDIIEVAKAHAAAQGLQIDYRAGSAESLLAAAQKFPVVTALEVIEHVEDPASFLATLAALLAPGGLLFLSTLNRTPKSFLVAKLGAEYLLRLLPVGTHDWRHFLRPQELAGLCRAAGLRPAEFQGLAYAPGRRGFEISSDMAVNYLAMAES